ncbi:MAG: hypothetical protein WA982_07175 [Rubrobacteraceae bacterium]
MFEIFVALILVAGIVGLILLPNFAPDVLVLFLAPLIPLAVILAFVLYPKLKDFSYRRWRITPQRITGHNLQALPSPGSAPEDLSHSIIERATEIRRAMKGKTSEIQVEMCALGYRACVNDMITLTHLVNLELSEAGFFRRIKLRRARRRATDVLSAARQTLPPGVLRATRQEQQ